MLKETPEIYFISFISKWNKNTDDPYLLITLDGILKSDIT